MRKNILKISVIEKKYGIITGVMIFFLLCFVFYYIVAKEDKAIESTLFLEAEALYANKEYEKAIDKYNEYLADSIGVSENERWSAWERILYITVQLNSDFSKGIAILREMEKEYAYDVQYMPKILKEMIQVYYMQHSKEDIIQTLQKLLMSELSLSNEEKIQFYRQYAILISENNKRFEQGEEQLELCIQKEEEPVARWCQYELGVMYTLDEKYKKGRAIFNTLIEKSRPDEEIYYSSRFMLATIYSFLGDKTKAIEELKAIENIYPNKEVIRSRIKALRKKEVTTLE